MTGRSHSGEFATSSGDVQQIDKRRIYLSGRRLLKATPEQRERAISALARRLRDVHERVSGRNVPATPAPQTDSR